MLDAYGDAIEADFHRFYGLDVVDVLRVDGGRRRLSFRKFRALVDRLPHFSATSAARLDDDERVSAYLDAAEASGELRDAVGGRKKPTFEGYTLEAQKLDRLAASVDRLFLLVDQALGGKNKVPPLVVPESARDRWERRQSRRRIDGLVAEVREAQERARARGRD